MNSYNNPNVLEINLNNFKHNIEEIKKITNNKEIMPVIKANAYGTHINTCLDVLNLFNIVAVANTLEGINLRNLGFKKDIFILNQPLTSDIPYIVKYNLIPGVSSALFVDELKKINENIRIHLEIGSGMGRTGINPFKVTEFVNNILDAKNITIEGVYTHLSSADSDLQYTENQLKNFDIAKNTLLSMVPSIKYIHAGASNGIINFSNSHYNLVRPGLIMYGYPSSIDTLTKINLKPICTLKSVISFIKTVPKNTSIGYNRSFITKKETVIATIPIGYEDGIKRSLGNKGYVVINGKKAPIIGNICMDSFMVDVSDIDCKINDIVYIWDNDLIKLEDIATICNTINYEILVGIGNRVLRKFI